tara:strand:- start:77 stop:235 length:159 start_codon:yes stop_codon:yes gene_type:complete
MIIIGGMRILEISLGFILQIGIHPIKRPERSKQDLKIQGENSYCQSFTMMDK